MNDNKTVLYLDSEISDMLDETCHKLGLTKSLLINVVLKELFRQVSPDDVFFNRVRVTGESILKKEGSASAPCGLKTLPQ